MRYPEYVARIIDRLEERGFEAYIVGGSVRDMLLGKTPNDYDVTTSARPEETLKIFKDMRTIPTGLKHGTVTVLSSGEPIEITTFRVDGEYLDSRRPESVSFTDDITADLSRRDFTVNAMAYSQKRGLIDAFGSREDLENKTIRAVRDPKLRFTEDALRIMRAFRFSAQLGFCIEQRTLEAAKERKEGLKKIAAERIAAEFIRTICTVSPNTVIEQMSTCGILEYVTNGYCPGTDILASLNKCKSAPHIRLGVFLSELDKESARDALHSLKLSNKLISDTLRVSSELSAPLRGTEADARRLICRCTDLTYDVLDAASALGRLESDFDQKVRAELEKKKSAKDGALAVNGGDIVKLGARGREVGEILTYLFDAVIEDPTLNEKEKLLKIAAERLVKG